MRSRTISEEELPRRDGVELLTLAGLDSRWSMPVALWHAPHGFDTRARPDNQPCNIIAVRLSGSLVQRIGPHPGRRERLRPDGFSVHPACSELRFLAPSKIRFAHIYVADDFLRRIFREVSPERDQHARFVREDRVMYEDAVLSSQISAYVTRAFDTLDPPAALEMESRANLIAIHFLNKHAPCRMDQRACEAKGRLADWQVQRVCSFMEANLNRNVDLTECSRLIGISNEHFCRAFRRTLNVPPHRWFSLKRMQHARRLLSETDASLTLIAQELGYTGQSAFGAAFRNAAEMTPQQYRRQSRSSATVPPDARAIPA